MSNLLFPRYRVHEDGYPESQFGPGSVVELSDVNSGQACIRKGGHKFYHPPYFDMFPHIFTKMEWYQARTIEELNTVKYLKEKSGGKVYKVNKYEEGEQVTLIGYRHDLSERLVFFTPATLDEYKNATKG